MIIRRENKKPRGIVAAIAAVEGFGKSTTMAKMPGAYFLDVDEGSFGLDVPCIEFDGTVAGLLMVLQEIKSGKAPDDMKTLCIDTADKLVLEHLQARMGEDLGCPQDRHRPWLRH